MAMADHDNLHSRVVAWLKIVLPLLALALLSTLFMVARTIDPEDAIPYARVDVEDRLREPRMTEPTFAGVTADGASLSLAASEARPGSGVGDKATGGAASRVVGRLDTPDGGHTDLAAADLVMDARGRSVTLSGGVEIDNSSGWRITAPGLTAALDRTDVTSTGGVQATGPAGTVSADGMRLSEDALHKGAYLLVFNGAVKLIYTPQN